MVSTVFKFLFLASLFAASYAFADTAPSFCSPLSNLEQKRWKDHLKWDIPQIVTQNLKDLHVELRTQDEDEVIRRRQMRAMAMAFDLGTWSNRLSTSAGVSQKPLEYLFGTWIKDRYLGSVLRMIRKDELTVIKRRTLPPAIAENANQYPLEPLITRISNFTCLTPEDNKTYRCGDKMLVVEAQLSPRILCSQSNAWTDYRIKLFVRIDAVVGPVIIDVERMQRRIYQTAFMDFEKLKGETTPQALLNLFAQWTFSSQKEIDAIPVEGLNALRNTNVNEAPAVRTPASTGK